MIYKSYIHLTPTNYNRIIVVGNIGSGKSYLSKKLATIIGLPLIHLDNEYWHPNWNAPAKNEWMQKQNDFVARDKWIIDGNYNGTMELRFKAADLIIFLDINRIVCLKSVLKRHGKKRSDLPDYLEEKFDLEFLEFCKQLWTFSKTRKKTILALHEKYRYKPFLVIKKRSTLNKMLHKWEKESIL